MVDIDGMDMGFGSFESFAGGPGRDDGRKDVPFPGNAEPRFSRLR